LKALERRVRFRSLVRTRPQIRLPRAPRPAAARVAVLAREMREKGDLVRLLGTRRPGLGLVVLTELALRAPEQGARAAGSVGLGALLQRSRAAPEALVDRRRHR